MHRWREFTRTDVLVGAACGVWTAVFFAPEGAAVALAALFGLAALLYRRAPKAGGLLVVAASALSAVAGVPGENAGGLAAGLTVTYGLGRYGDRRGLLVVGALAIGTVAPHGLVLIDLVFTACLLLAFWGCGRLVRRRTLLAERAAETAAALAEQDPRELAQRVVVEERARLAGEALGVVRRAVRTMHHDALAAEATLDLASLGGVQERGREAVAELRSLLGLLRSAGPPDERPPEKGSLGAERRGPSRPHPPAVRRHAGRRLPSHADALTALGLVAVGAAETAAFGDDVSAGSLALTLLFAACVALRGIDAPLACALAVAPPALAAALDAPLVYGFSTGAALALLAWSVGDDGRGRALLALAVLAGVTLVVGHADDPGNEGISVALVVLPAVAGHLWGARGREGDASEATATALRAAQEAAAERATRAERLRLARELHDVASHAVGVMVLQAGAAEALRDRDPAAARAAVREVQRAGAEAIAELDVLFGVLDAGAVGPPGLAAAPEPDLGPALEALVRRVRGGGLDVRLTVDAEPTGGEVAAVALRVVQEALTNAVRYAPGSRVSARVERTGDELVVEVRDDGTGPATHDPGFGLLGLRERVRALGGEFAAGPADGGGFVVTARLPASDRTGAPA